MFALVRFFDEFIPFWNNSNLYLFRILSKKLSDLPGIQFAALFLRIFSANTYFISDQNKLTKVYK